MRTIEQIDVEGSNGDYKMLEMILRLRKVNIDICHCIYTHCAA